MDITHITKKYVQCGDQGAQKESKKEKHVTTLLGRYFIVDSVKECRRREKQN